MVTPSPKRLNSTPKLCCKWSTDHFIRRCHRQIKRSWISVEEGTSENNRRSKFYRLTAKGRRPLDLETRKWDKLAGTIERILRPAE